MFFLPKTNNVDSPVDDIWNKITAKIQSLLVSYVPSKMSSTRFNQPWINRDLKKLARRKKKAYRKARFNRDEHDMARNKKLKSNMQEGCRKAYNFFINNKICDEMSTSPKNF